MGSNTDLGNIIPRTLLGEGSGTPLQYSCLENLMDGGAWKAAAHGVAEGRTHLSDFTFTFHFHALSVSKVLLLLLLLSRFSRV